METFNFSEQKSILSSELQSELRNFEDFLKELASKEFTVPFMAFW